VISKVGASVRRISGPGLGEPPGATWSNGLMIGREIVLSGLTARGPDGKPMGGANVRDQTLAVFERMRALLRAGGGDIANVYKLVIYLTDMARKDEVNAARAAFFRPLYPCSTLVEVKGLVFPDLLVEVDVFANLDVDRHQAAEAAA
jgi:2-iminobutanoate/2-iminopropanoate deaminase